MRLLNVHTLEFEEFVGEVGNGIPPYTILSHTWGPEEVTFKDYAERGREGTEKKGYDKIRGCCQLSESEGFQYVWIDTCCIDKGSSAELSEAINSMFQWYRDAAICYAYLSDVDASEDPDNTLSVDSQSEGSSSFARSRWFTRGWTLQELLAPSEVIFLAADWSEIGTKKSLRGAVSRVTGISEKALQECRWDEYSVAQKMSWAASRQTTRLEDAAYCLMGLFDVNMPLLYGEGSKAFSRLQQAIMQRTEDQSIFAWSYPDDEHSHTSMSGIMAPSPQYFKDCSQIETLDQVQDYQGPFEVVNQLVRIRSRLVDDIQGMKLRTYASNPLLHSVVEVQTNKGPQALDEFAKSSAPSKVSPWLQGEREIPSLADFAFKGEPIFELKVDEAFSVGSVDNDLGNDSQAVDGDTGTRKAEDLVPLGQPAWRWYIYETVVIAPLRCRIGRNQLGILLSRGLARSVVGMVNLRLHNPSVVIIDDITAKLEAATVQTMYVAISKPRELFKQALSAALDGSFNALCWPEIRYNSLRVAGYRAVRDAGPAWVVDSDQSLVRSLHPHAIDHGDTKDTDRIDYSYAPVVLFYHESGKDSTYPTLFLRLMVTSPYPAGARTLESSITCDLGVYNPAGARSTASMVEDFRVYSANILQDRGMEVASGHDGHSVAVRVRQGNGVFFVNVSFQKALHGRLKEPKDISDTPEVKLLRTQLFPKLKSARASFAEHHQLPRLLDY